MGHTATVDAAPGRRRTIRIGRTTMVVTTLLAAQVAVWGQAQAARNDQGDGGDPPGLECFQEARGTIGASAQTITHGQTVTLSWTAQVTSGCEALEVMIDQWPVARTGSMAVAGVERSSLLFEPRFDPYGTPTYFGHLRTHYTLRVVFGAASRELATATVDVRLPVDAAGRPAVTVAQDHEVQLFLLALRTPEARVTLAPQVALDLTGYPTTYVARGVTVFGGRTSRVPGALIYIRCTGFAMGGLLPYCTSTPQILFMIHANTPSHGVRFSGLRIAGLDMDVPPADSTTMFAFVIISATNVEIDNSEIYGWRGSAIRVVDSWAPNICHTPNGICPTRTSDTIRIHDNYIHHNRHRHGDGYGVSVHNGAYALIERNVFDYNRHAIMGGGEPDTGYLARRNLVLEHGGENRSVAGAEIYTHQFDMHGTDTCDEFLWLGPELNCGGAGEYMDIRFNSFFYTRDNAFKLRGHPSLGVDVVSNVFKHQFIEATGTVQGALAGYVDEITVADDNLLGSDEHSRGAQCDFDADGIADDFLATGQTWWFRSKGRHWNYLNTSRARLSELSLGDVDGDGRCDVVVGGVVSSGGGGPFVRNRGDIVWQASTGFVDGVGNEWRRRRRGDLAGRRPADLAARRARRLLG